MSEDTRRRLDEALVLRGLAPSRARARDAIKRGTVSVDGSAEAKPARMVGAAQTITHRRSRGAIRVALGVEADRRARCV